MIGAGQGLSLQDKVQFLKGVGPSRAELLEKLDIHTVGDLIFHLPRSYDDLSDVRSVAQLTAGTLQTVHGEVVEIDSKELANGRRVISIVVADTNGQCVEGLWFNQVSIARQFRFGQRVAFSGKPKWHQDHWRMNHPRVQHLDQAEEAQRKLVPVYPLTENLYADRLQGYIRQAMEKYRSMVPEALPASLRAKRSFLDVASALRQAHFPDSMQQALASRHRFIYEEFLVLQVALALRRRELRDRKKAPRLPVDQAIDAHIRRLFPFALTDDQNRAVGAICRDLAGDRPMQRLLQADVGAGKTAVAVYGLLVAVANKHQAALMAPTEVLARQHWSTVESYLAQSRVRRLLLTGSLTQKERRRALEDIQEGNVDLVVGTQALIQKDVQFARLGLVVIDEQHKFGVHQRARMRQGFRPSQTSEVRPPKPLGESSSPAVNTGSDDEIDPHYLVMTATPIPRTVALTTFGDLDSSVIRQLPPGRQKVMTRWLTDSQKERTFEHLVEQIRKGRQAYVVCPLVEESESLDVKAAEQTFVEVKEGPFREFRVGLLHGRLSDDAKDQVMAEFRAGRIDVLVATLVIEVGVDVPNATLMVILHADRFGLSQLHQLRGRVTRGPVAGECYLFANTGTDEARERLRILTRTSDGFLLAEEDARMRGLGEFFGSRQHGLGAFRFGDPLADRVWLEYAREDAIALVTEDASLQHPEHEQLRRLVIERYGKVLDLATVG